MGKQPAFFDEINRNIPGSLSRTKGKYNIIYADPPWDYGSRNNPKTSFGLGQPGRYPGMSMKDIELLPVKNIADDDCALFLWVTFPYLHEGIHVMEAWKFKYTTLGFNWVKINKKNGRPFFGVGYYTKSNSEICLLGIKGKMKPVSDRVSSQLVNDIEAKQRHSKKPNSARERIVELFGDIPRIELFARQRTAGWDVWGNEVECDVILGNK